MLKLCSRTKASGSIVARMWGVAEGALEIAKSLS